MGKDCLRFRFIFDFTLVCIMFSKMHFFEFTGL
jgi:hypothetical protein